jgi:hypothetical protein
MTIRAAAILLASLTLAACTTTATPPPAPVALRPIPPAGLERVIGRDARTLAALFGTPDQDQREPGARRLQYASAVCVLDAYLYPPAAGKEPVVTWIDARRPTGEDFDRASCIAALTRRGEAR